VSGPGPGLKAAAGRVDITPTGPAYIAGYAPNRLSSGAHDPLSARCLVLESGDLRIALVSCDLLAVPRFQLQKIRAAVRSVAPERLYVAATHTHSGPDTIGQWGPDRRTSGVDQEWMALFRDRVADLVDQTAENLKAAVVSFAASREVPRISKNIRVPRILDTELAVMQVCGRDGAPIGALVNFACHPEVLNNRLISADFPHWLYGRVEGEVGVCLFMNGALGGMVTADFDESTALPGGNWQAAQEIGQALGDRTLELLADAQPIEAPTLDAQQRVFQVPLRNEGFRDLIEAGITGGREGLRGGFLETEVNRITVGPAEFLTLPGEALANVGLYLKRLMAGSPRFILGLTCDELGYILAPEDFGLELYGYETRVSVGPEIEPLMVQHLRSMMRPPANGHPQ
jgi:hypothetical protein